MQLHRRSSNRSARQSGASIFGFFVIAVIVGFVALMLMRVFPAVNEFFTIRRAVTQIMKGSPTSAAQIRQEFNRQIEIEYSIGTIEGKDLEIAPVGDKFRTSFAYNKEIEIMAPVFLLLKFEGSATSPGSASIGSGT